jgi:hypothetical protein
MVMKDVTTVLHIGHLLFCILTIELHGWHKLRCLQGSTTVSLIDE